MTNDLSQIIKAAQEEIHDEFEELGIMPWTNNFDKSFSRLIRKAIAAAFDATRVDLIYLEDYLTKPEKNIAEENWNAALQKVREKQNELLKQ